MSNPNIALVTGASGFVGSAVVRRLLQDGMSVRALVRKQSNRSAISGLDVHVVEGDMRDAESLQRATQGVRYLFHVAADYRLWAPDPNDIITTNVDGTRIVMEAARAAGVEKIVYTSSVATLKPSDEGAPVDETSRLDAAQAIGAYKRSKVLAEQLVERMVAEQKLPAVIVNPSTPIGPRDVRPTPTGRIVVEAACGRMPAFVDTGLNIVHVDDVATGHVAALRKGKIGERYILGGEDMTLARMLAHIAAAAGRRPPTVKLPRQLVYPIAYGSEVLARFTGRDPFATVDGLRMAKYKMFFSSSKATRDLGYRVRPAIDAIQDAYGWFKSAGYLS